MPTAMLTGGSTRKKLSVKFMDEHQQQPMKMSFENDSSQANDISQATHSLSPAAHHSSRKASSSVLSGGARRRALKPKGNPRQHHAPVTKANGGHGSASSSSGAWSRTPTRRRPKRTDTRSSAEKSIAAARHQRQRRPSWDSTINDLAQYKASQDEIAARKLRYTSRNNFIARAGLTKSGITEEEQEEVFNSILTPRRNGHSCYFDDEFDNEDFGNNPHEEEDQRSRQSTPFELEHDRVSDIAPARASSSASTRAKVSVARVRTKRVMALGSSTSSCDVSEMILRSVHDDTSEAMGCESPENNNNEYSDTRQNNIDTSVGRATTCTRAREEYSKLSPIRDDEEEDGDSKDSPVLPPTQRKKKSQRISDSVGKATARTGGGGVRGSKRQLQLNEQGTKQNLYVSESDTRNQTKPSSFNSEQQSHGAVMNQQQQQAGTGAEEVLPHNLSTVFHTLQQQIEQFEQQAHNEGDNVYGSSGGDMQEQEKVGRGGTGTDPLVSVDSIVQMCGKLTNYLAQSEKKLQQEAAARVSLENKVESLVSLTHTLSLGLPFLAPSNQQQQQEQHGEHVDGDQQQQQQLPVHVAKQTEGNQIQEQNQQQSVSPGCKTNEQQQYSAASVSAGNGHTNFTTSQVNARGGFAQHEMNDDAARRPPRPQASYPNQYDNNQVAMNNNEHFGPQGGTYIHEGRTNAGSFPREFGRFMPTFGDASVPPPEMVDAGPGGYEYCEEDGDVGSGGSSTGGGSPAPRPSRVITSTATPGGRDRSNNSRSRGMGGSGGNGGVNYLNGDQGQSYEQHRQHEQQRNEQWRQDPMSSSPAFRQMVDQHVGNHQQHHNERMRMMSPSLRQQQQQQPKFVNGAPVVRIRRGGLLSQNSSHQRNGQMNTTSRKHEQAHNAGHVHNDWAGAGASFGSTGSASDVVVVVPRPGPSSPALQAASAAANSANASVGTVDDVMW